MNTKKKSANKKNKSYQHIRLIAIIAAFCAAIGAYFYRVYFVIEPADPLKKIFLDVQAIGLTPNYLLSGNLLPGTIIQVKDGLGENGKDRCLKSPIIVFKHTECYEGEIDITSVPHTNIHGSENEAIHLSAKVAPFYLPKINSKAVAIKEFILHMGQTKLWSFPKGKTIAGMRQHCGQVFDIAQRSGDKIEWYQVIQDAIVADHISVEIIWKHEPTAEMLASLTKSGDSKLDFSLGSHSKSKTVLQCDQPVVIGYRGRPIEKILFSKAPDLRSSFTESESGSIEASNQIGSFSIQLIDNSLEKEVGLQHEFKKGDKIRFVVETKKSGWIYLYHRMKGELNALLWPKRDKKRALPLINYARARTKILIPGAMRAFEFNEEIGDEFFTLVISEGPNLHEHYDEKRPGDEKGVIDGIHSLNYLSMYVTKGVNEVQIGRAQGPSKDVNDPKMYFAAPPESSEQSIMLKFRLIHK
jgi:hypothetical protein